jgi:hypothetical protein
MRDRVETCDGTGHWQPGTVCACVDPGVCADPDAGSIR